MEFDFSEPMSSCSGKAQVMSLSLFRYIGSTKHGSYYNLGSTKTVLTNLVYRFNLENLECAMDLYFGLIGSWIRTEVPFCRQDQVILFEGNVLLFLINPKNAILILHEINSLYLNVSDKRHWKQGVKLLNEPVEVGNGVVSSIDIETFFDPSNGELSLRHAFLTNQR